MSGATTDGVALADAVASGAAGGVAATPPHPGGVSTTGRVMRGALMLLSAQPVTWVASLLLTVYTPRYLDGRAMGEMGIAVSAAAVVGTIAMLGIPMAITRIVAAGEPNANTSVTTGLAMVVGLSLTGALMVVSLGPTSGLLAVSVPLLLLALAGMVVSQVQSVLYSVLTGQQRLKAFAWLNAGCMLLISVLSVGALMLGAGAAGVLVVTAVVTAAATAITWQQMGIRLDRGGLTWGSTRSLAATGLPFLAWNVLLRVRGDVDSIVLGRLLSVEAVGWWAAGQRIIAIPVFVPVLVATPLLPALTSIRDDLEAFGRTLRRSFELTVLLTVGVSAVIAGFATVIPSTLGWSPEYAAAVPIMQVMAPVLPLVSISMVLGTALIALGKERRWLLVNLVATSVQYVVLFLGIPLADAQLGIGAIGAAAGRLAAELMMVGGAVILLPRGMIGSVSWLYVARVALSGVACALVILTLSTTSIILAGLAGGLVYAGGQLLFRTVQVADLEAALEFVRSGVRRRTASRPAPSQEPPTADRPAEPSAARSDGADVYR